jgi:glutamate carboxypeptidase
VLLAALQEFERHEAARHVGYTVLMNPDEEIGSPASASLIAETGQRAHMGMTYEPALADGSLAGARKGSGNWSVTFRGKASHAGRDHHLGRSAIAAAADFITRLEAGNGQREGVTFNTGKVDGGGPVNIVPELAIVRFNTRLAEPDQAAFIETHIRACMDAVARRDGIQAELHGGFTRPPKPMAPANAAVFDFTRRAGAALGLTIQWADTGGVCEGNNLWAAGCPNVDTLGVRGAHIHSDRELVKLSSFAERAKLSYVMLAAIADGAFDPRPLRGLAK